LRKSWIAYPSRAFNRDRSHSGRALRLLVLGLALLYASPSKGQQGAESGANQEGASGPSDDGLNRTTLSGDWGGERTRLEKAGINLRAHFLTESAANPIGGKSQTTRHTQQVDFGADIDLGRLIDISGGRVQITFTDRVGRSLSADAIGNQFAVQQLYGAGQNFRLAELNYQQNLFADKLIVDLGWSPVGDHFASLPVLCDFQNGFICGHLNGMTINSGAQNFPTGQWGARITVNPKKEFYVSTGIFKVNPNASDSDKGFDLSFQGTGVFVPVELGWLTGREMQGTYKVGAYYNSSPTPDVFTDVNGNPAGLTGEPFATRNGRSGVYAMADQWIHRPRTQGPEPRRGLRIGAVAGLGDRATATFRYFLAGGGVYQGTFKHRDHDFVSLLVAHAHYNDRLTRYQEDRNVVAPGTVGIQHYENILEADYNAQIARWFSFRPNLQYVLNPGAPETFRTHLSLVCIRV